MPVGPGKDDSTVAKPWNKQRKGSLDARDPDNGRSPVHLTHLARLGLQRDKNFRSLSPKLLNTLPDRAFASGKLIFLHETGIHPPGRMSLFYGTFLIFFEPLFNDGLDRSDDRGRLLTTQAVPGNLLQGDRFPHGRSIEAKMPGNVADRPPFLKMLLLDKLDMDHSDHPFFLPDKALTLPSTTLQEEGAGVVYFFIPTFPSTGTLLHYHSHLLADQPFVKRSFKITIAAKGHFRPFYQIPLSIIKYR